jgi:hypothetical protein
MMAFAATPPRGRGLPTSLGPSAALVTVLQLG